MYCLIFISTAVKQFSTAELLDLLNQSRIRNKQLRLSGRLLYKNGNFLQLLEGEKTAVELVFARICRDPRHRNIVTLLRGQQDERQYEDWSMAFEGMDAEEATSTPGFSNFLMSEHADVSLLNLSRSQKLLLAFKRHSRQASDLPR